MSVLDVNLKHYIKTRKNKLNNYTLLFNNSKELQNHHTVHNFNSFLTNINEYLRRLEDDNVSEDKAKTYRIQIDNVYFVLMEELLNLSIVRNKGD